MSTSLRRATCTGPVICGSRREGFSASDGHVRTRLSTWGTVGAFDWDLNGVESPHRYQHRPHDLRAQGQHITYKLSLQDE